MAFCVVGVTDSCTTKRMKDEKEEDADGFVLRGGSRLRLLFSCVLRSSLNAVIHEAQAQCVTCILTHLTAVWSDE